MGPSLAGQQTGARLTDYAVLAVVGAVDAAAIAGGAVAVVPAVDARGPSRVRGDAAAGAGGAGLHVVTVGKIPA